MRVSILNRLGVGHECDGQTDRQTDYVQTEPPLEIARSNDAR